VATVEGTAEYRLESSGTWQVVEEGITLPAGAQLSTGFRSSLSLTMGRSEVTVGPLSRTTIAKLDDERAPLEAGMDLPYGRLRARVKTAGGERADFRVRSPISTAAVRGTVFTFDGFALSVDEGDVELSNRTGQSHSVRAGQISRTYAFEPIVSVEQTLAEEID